MLSRVADALFWMSRYLERAEHTARLLDVCFHLDLDLRGVLPGSHGPHWGALAAVLQQHPPGPPPGRPPPALARWLTLDPANPNSIVSCVARSRANARGIRGRINAEMWRELNKLHLHLSDPEFCARAGESPHEFYQAVECGSHAFQGACDATLTHDEGWHFIQLGKFLERADKTLRVLDVQYGLLHGLTDPAGHPLANLQWAAVLRSFRAYEAYQRLYAGRVEPEHLVEFLLLLPTFPRSARFCLEALARSLEVVEGAPPGAPPSRAARALGRLLADLRYAEPGRLVGGDLHAFLGGLLQGCGDLGRAVQQQYALR
jgi:uncharacterized alpha-E superfamily protein